MLMRAMSKPPPKGLSGFTKLRSSSSSSSSTGASPVASGSFGPFADAVVPGLAVIECGQSSTGSMLEWFKEQLAPTATFAELDADAEGVPVGSGGVIVLDTWQGCRTPHADGKARGAIWGMSLATTRGHLFRALLEGIAYGTRAMAEAAGITAAGATDGAGGGGAASAAGGAQDRHSASPSPLPSVKGLSRLAVVGGATQSETFMKLLADVVGVPLVTVGAGDRACAVAAAVVAAAGYTGQPLATVSKSFVKDGRAYIPDMKRHAQYEFYYQQHQETYSRLKGGFHAMAAHVAADAGN